MRDFSRTLGAAGPELPSRFLSIGEGVLLAAPVWVVTVLGSCVAVSFHSARLGAGGIFHALMPTADEQGRREHPYRYVDSAVEHMLQRFATLGVRPQGMECKVFGGAAGLFSKEAGVGERNVRAALESLAARNIRVAASDVGGRLGRKLVFQPATGEVFVRRLTGTPTAPAPPPGRSSRG